MNPVQKYIWAIAAATLALFLSCAIGILFSYYVAASNRQTICTFRSDLERRLVSSKAYLKKLDRGEIKPIQGFTKGDIRLQIMNQERTVKALKPPYVPFVGEC